MAGRRYVGQGAWLAGDIPFITLHGFNVTMRGNSNKYTLRILFHLGQQEARKNPTLRTGCMACMIYMGQSTGWHEICGTGYRLVEDEEDMVQGWQEM